MPRPSPVSALYAAGAADAPAPPGPAWHVAGRSRVRGFGSGLERLVLRDCGPLPAGITRLTGLESLAWENSYLMADRNNFGAAGPPDPAKLRAAAADGALSCLTRLTFLSLMTLESEEAGAARLPPSLSSLSQLHTACLLGPSHLAMPLPASGPYLTSLRRLLFSTASAAASLPALSAMPHLERLSLMSCSLVMEWEGYQVGVCA